MTKQPGGAPARRSGALKRVSGLQQERAVVADVVDDGELLVARGLAEAAAGLLEPEDA